MSTSRPVLVLVSVSVMSLFIPHLSGLADEDLDALVAFIKSVPAYKNKIPERKLDPAFEKTLAVK